MKYLKPLRKTLECNHSKKLWTTSNSEQCNGFRGSWTEIAKLKNLWVFTILLATLALKEVTK